MEPKLEYVWSQAFYYAVFAAILYLACASLMVVTFLGAQSGRYDKDFQLTTSQRTLMLQTIMFLMYLLIGALVFSKTEDWAYLDAVYWADVTLFTIGFGDMYAMSTVGRALLIPYALVGVISLGLVIGSIRSLALERGKRRLDARMIEKKRRRIVRRMTMRGKDDILVPIRDDGESGGGDAGSHGGGGGRTEYERRGQEFQLMRKILHQAAVRRRWTAMAISTGTWLVLWLVGARIFQNCEQPYQNWSYFDGVYFAFVSLTTIGYGDITPVSNSGKAFFVFWSLLALPTMTVLISNAGDTIIKVIRDGTNALGTVTILPGERGLKRDLKGILKTLSFGRLFDDGGIEARPPGFLGAAQPTDGEEDDDEEEDEGTEKQLPTPSPDEKADPTKAAPSAAGGGSSSTNSREPSSSSEPRRQPSKLSTRLSAHSSRKSPASPSSSTLRLRSAPSIPRSDFPKDLPRSRAEYHVMLIDKITTVTRHLKHTPPRKYTFQEWAWYLKLIGEDEHSAETHKKARPHVHDRSRGGGSHHGRTAAHAHAPTPAHAHGCRGAAAEGEPKTEELAAEESRAAWSWVGTRSPLMGSQEEAEWILEKLTMRLQAELKMEAKEESEAGGTFRERRAFR